VIRTAIHRLAHRLGLNVGSLVLMRRPEGRLVRAFVCDRCGKIQLMREVTRDEARRLALTSGDRWELGPGPIPGTGPGPIATRRGGDHA
jgi:hypothetical protein